MVNRISQYDVTQKGEEGRDELADVGPFAIHIAVVRHLYIMMVGFLCVPILAEWFLRIGPPHIIFRQRVVITSMFAFLAVVCCYATRYRDSVANLGVWVRRGIVVALSAFAAYWVIIQACSCVNHQEDNERVVIGFVYREAVTRLIAHNPVISAAELLAAAGWDARKVWAEWSVTTVEAVMFIIWSVATVAASLAFSCFALQLAKRRPRPSREGKKKTRKKDGAANGAVV